MRRIITLIAACLAGAFCIVLGYRFIFDPIELSQNQYITAGLILVFSGILLSSIEYIYRWLISFIFIAIGTYFLARAAGTIDYSWLSIVAGIFLWVVAGFMAHIIGDRLMKKT